MNPLVLCYRYLRVDYYLFRVWLINLKWKIQGKDQRLKATVEWYDNDDINASGR
jgi:hypothetical protein